MASSGVLSTLRLPEPKTAKNRLHLDLTPSERTRDEELGWLLEHGATEVADRRQPDGGGWVVLADPDDNVSIVRPTREGATIGV